MKMYWFQPADDRQASLSLEGATVSSGPWTNISFAAEIKQTNYWCEQRGITAGTAGECYLVEFLDGPLYIRGRALAVNADGTNSYSDYSATVYLPEPGTTISLAVMLFVLLIFERMTR